MIKSNSNNNSKLHHDQSPAVTSSRYSNTNTACTRNLFTPSEDNCLSQHLANYSNKKPERVVSTSDLTNLDLEQINCDKNNFCNTVMEERSREEANTEESLFSLKSPDNINKKNIKHIVVENQEKKNPSILQLEDMVDILIKEQQNLKNKIIDQEKILSTISKPNSTTKTQVIEQIVK